jgi:predicted dehydrogenase
MPLRLIQVGAGAWGASWLNVVHGSADWELTAVVDLDPVKLERAGVPEDRRFASLAEALAATRADAALVAVPPQAHAEVAIEALGAGMHCLVEKPLAPAFAEAETVVKRAEAAHRRLMVSQNFRFTRGARTVQGLVREGAVGQVEEAHVRFFRTPLLTGFRLQLDEPLLLDMGIHHFDLMRFILDFEPARVTMSSSNPTWSPFEGNASAIGGLENADGMAVSYVGSWATRGPETTWEGDWAVHGDAGWIGWSEGRILHAPPGVTLRPTLKRRLRGRPLPRSVPLEPLPLEQRAGVLAEFAAAIREDREPEAGGRENLRSLAVTLAAVESARTGKIVDVAAFREATVE